MKKVGDLFEELGFRKDASDGVKRAFVENLVKAAAQSAPPRADRRATTLPTPAKEEQLSFDFSAGENSNGPETPFPARKRNAG